jgi:hypothetical protein
VLRIALLLLHVIVCRNLDEKASNESRNGVIGSRVTMLKAAGDRRDSRTLHLAPRRSWPIEQPWLHTTTTPALSPLRTNRTMANWLQDVANFVAVATAAVPWHVIVFVAVAIYIAWRVWPRIYGILHLGTQMERLLDERRTLVEEDFPARYHRLAPATVTWAEGAIERCVLYPCILDKSSFSFHPGSPLLLEDAKLVTVRCLLFELAGSSTLLKSSTCMWLYVLRVGACMRFRR